MKQNFLSYSFLLFLSFLPFLTAAQCETGFDPYDRQNYMQAKVTIKEASQEDPTIIKARFVRQGLGNFAEFTIAAPHLTGNSRIDIGDYFGVQFEERRAICFVVERPHYTHKTADGTYAITFRASATGANYVRLANSKMLAYRYTMQRINYEHSSPIPDEVARAFQQAMACWKVP